MKKIHTIIPKLRVRSWPSRTRILLGPSWDPVPQRPTMIGGGRRPGIPDIWGYRWGWCPPDLGRYFRFIVPTSWRSLKIIEDPFVQVVELTLSCTWESVWESLGQTAKWFVEIALRNCPESELSDDGGIATGLKDLRSLCSLCRSHWMIWMIWMIWIYMDLSDLSDPLDHCRSPSLGTVSIRKLKRFWHHSAGCIPPDQGQIHLLGRQEQQCDCGWDVDLVVADSFAKP